MDMRDQATAAAKLLGHAGAALRRERAHRLLERAEAAHRAFVAEVANAAATESDGELREALALKASIGADWDRGRLAVAREDLERGSVVGAVTAAWVVAPRCTVPPEADEALVAIAKEARVAFERLHDVAAMAPHEAFA